MIGERIAHFRIVDTLGEGGMGVVYRAFDERLRREVALKVLPDSLASDPERRRRFLREARAAASVTHGNIAAVHDIGEADGHVFIAMELVSGETLRAKMAPGLTHPEALRIAKEVAKGLARAHDSGVVHRDLKPENVMVTKEGDVKILDFGLAKLVDVVAAEPTGATESQLTGEGRVLGTPPYMSPEQVEGRSAVDARSDVFSFGVMLYEMLSGVRPFQGSTSIAVLYAVLHTEPQPLDVVCPDVPALAATLVARCLQKKVAERFASGRELLAALGSDSVPPGAVSSGRAIPAVKLPTVSGMGTALGATIARDTFPVTTASASPAKRRTWRGPLMLAAAIVATVVSVAGLRRWGGDAKPTVAAPSASAAVTDGVSRSTNPEAQRFFDEAMRSFHDGTGQAVSLLQSAVTADPSFGGAYLRLWAITHHQAIGNTLDTQSYWPGAEHSDDYRRRVIALQAGLSPRDRELFDALDSDAAAFTGALDAYLARFPHDDVAWWCRLDASAATVARALAVDPTLVPAIAARAMLLPYQDGVADALKVVAHCLELSPRAADCLYVRGIWLDETGQCEASVSDFNRVLELTPDARNVRPRLAGLLAARGASLDAVRETLGPTLANDPFDGHLALDALIPFFAGDFVEVERLARDALTRIRVQATEEEHWAPTTTLLHAYIEAGESANAAAVAADYLSRRAAWNMPTLDWLGPAIGAAARGGRMERKEANRRLDATFQLLLDAKGDPAIAWAKTYANASETPAEGIAAVGKLDELKLPMPTSWRGATARALFLGGRGEAARSLLAGPLHTCSNALLVGRNWIHAHLYLGELDEARGDKASACEHYAKVVERWGHAKPRSVLADEARAHAKALGCGEP